MDQPARLMYLINVVYQAEAEREHLDAQRQKAQAEADRRMAEAQARGRR